MSMDLPKMQAEYNRIWSEVPEYRGASPEARYLHGLAINTWPKEHFKTFLSVGCGDGIGLRVALVAGMEVKGLDIADGLADDYKDLPGCFVHGEAHHMPFEDKQFDIVSCCDVLEHIPAEFIRPTIKEIARVTAKRMIISVTMTPARLVEGAHVTLRPVHWWLKRLVKHGLLHFIKGSGASVLMVFERLPENA